MSNVSIFLKFLSPVFLMVGILHLVLGPNAEILLGANIPATVLSDPVLDSQNRFYGVAFGLYGALFYLCSTDIWRYLVVLRCILLFFFAGGVARLVSIYVVGLPSTLVIVLLVSEIILPIVLLFWVSRLNNEN